MKKLTTEEFIEKAKQIHSDKYDYSLVKYINSYTKIKIICQKHDIFKQTPSGHLHHGCFRCSQENNGNKTKRFSIDEFINKSNIKHQYKYDYSLVEYINVETKVKIICPIHGIFEQIPKHHMNGIKCPNCSHNKKYTNKDFIIKCKLIHGNKYDYSLVEYKNSKKNKVKIICPYHGIFEQIPYEHKNGSGCPVCNESKGERKIRNFLNEKNIKYQIQKRFKDCKYKNTLSFDFYLPKYNICIEYDGIQHYNIVEKWGGQEKLKIIQIRDEVKNEYCLKNNIRLLRIKYNEDIDDVLNKELFNI